MQLYKTEAYMIYKKMHVYVHLVLFTKVFLAIMISFLCLFRASNHFPSQTDMSIPGFRMKSEVPGTHRRS